jgi:succinate dehydrogenase / fumarate reductase, cytochrome b subunit
LSSTSSGSVPTPWQFLLYRLFSLSGLIPVGAFLCVHLLANSTVISGAANFQKAVNGIHALGPALPVVEWLFIFIPMIFHATMGFMIISGAVVNVGSYPYGGNIRYTLQRASGIIAFFFIIGHIMHMHHYGKIIGLGLFVPSAAASSAAIAMTSVINVILYIVGVAATTYHFANGLWTQGITWGVWTSVNAMKRANYICAAVGIGLFCIGMTALVGLKTLDIEKAKQVEGVMYEAHQRENGVLPTSEKPAKTPVSESKPEPAPAAATPSKDEAPAKSDSK